MNDVFPPMYLPGRAEEWGRSIQNRIIAGETFEEQVSQKVDNGLRAASGQLAVLANQITDLTERATLVSRLYGVMDIPTNASGLGSGYWSFFDFTITKPRSVVIDFAYSATLSQTVAGTSLGSFGVGYKTDPLDLITNLPISTIVGGPELFMGSIGATSDSILGKVSLQLLPGRYNIYLSGIVSGPASLDSANLQLRNGITTLSIGQADYSIEESDIAPFTP